MSDHSTDFSECEEGQQHDKTYGTDRQNTLYATVPHRRKTLRKHLSMPKPDQHRFYDVEPDQDQSKNEGLVKDRVDEWFMAEASPKAEMLTNQKNFREDERVDNRKGVFRIIDVVF
jgi:hypothetical protein